MRVRSITLFARTALPLDTAAIASLGHTAQIVAETYAGAGYEVQTIRYATSLFHALAQLGDSSAIVDTVVALEECCQASGFAFVSLGPAEAEMLPVIPNILRATQSVFATSPIVKSDGVTIDGVALQGAARVIHTAANIEAGFGNLRFAAIANVSAGTPFFPAGYWNGSVPALAIATESADLALAACREAADAAEAHATLCAAITRHGKQLDAIGRKSCREHALQYLGVDFSLAPYPGPGNTVSIGGALEALTGQPLGAAGTLAAAAILTDAIQQAKFQHTGFCGLMLPVLEDGVLAQRAAEGRLHTGDLLQWSAVCGTGLDTVPLPGDATVESLASLLFDVGALSVRLHKPLTARLMPLPGKVAGDPVHFDFAYFADGGVLPLECGEGNGPLSKAHTLGLHQYQG